MRNYSLTLAALLLAGCATRPPVVPSIVHVEVVKIVPVPDALTAPCDVYQIKANTYGEAIAAANFRKAALVACNLRLAEIRALGRTP